MVSGQNSPILDETGKLLKLARINLNQDQTAEINSIGRAVSEFGATAATVRARQGSRLPRPRQHTPE
jgi:hypothetical protein